MTKKYTILHGDCLDRLKELPDNSVDSCVTDPPYGLSKEPDISEVLTKWLNGEEYDHGHGGFMGKAWDSFVPHPDIWSEVFRVLKPGGHALVFAGTRTQDLMTISLRMAGFEVRDVIEWLYFSGFPKSMDVSKSLDKRERGRLITQKIKHFRESRGLSMTELANLVGVGANNIHDWEVGGHSPGERRWNDIKLKLGVSDEEEKAFEREKVGEKAWSNSANHFVPGEDHTERVNLGITAPATELARKWDGWGTSLKPSHEPIIVVRKPLVDADTGRKLTVADCVEKYGTGAVNIDGCRIASDDDTGRPQGRDIRGGNFGGGAEDKKSDLVTVGHEAGRFPANAITTEADAFYSKYFNVTPQELSKKASKKDRNSDWQGEEIDLTPREAKYFDGGSFEGGGFNNGRKVANNHPTVKPTDLMAWLVRLVTPVGGTVLDPFAGSGSTLVAAKREGFGFIGIEREAEYVEIIEARTGEKNQAV